MPMNRLTGYLLVAAAALLWGCLGPMSKLLFADGISPLEVSFWRSLFASVLYIAHIVFTRPTLPRTARDITALTLFGVIGIALLFTLYQYTVHVSGVALAAVLLYTAPIFVAVFSRIFLGERLSAFRIVAVGLSFAGITAICLSGGSHETLAKDEWVSPLLGFIGGISCGLLYAGHFFFNNVYLKKFTAPVIYAWATLAASITLFPLVEFAPKTTENWLLLGIGGAVCTYVAYFLYCEGIRRISLTQAAVTSTLEPVVATFAAVFFFAENFSFIGWLGIVATLVAVLIMVVAPRCNE